MKQTHIYALTDCLTFGKYRGCSIQYVLQKEPQYIQWCLLNVDGFKMDKAAWKYAISIDDVFVHLIPEEQRKEDNALVEKQLANGVELLAHYPWKDPMEARRSFIQYARSVAEDIVEIQYSKPLSLASMAQQLHLPFV